MSRKRHRTKNPTSLNGRYVGKRANNIGTVTREQYAAGQTFIQVAKSGKRTK